MRIDSIVQPKRNLMVSRTGCPAESLADDEVHIWQAALNGIDAQCGLSECLSEDERARASRFRFTKGRHEFVISRMLLRSILALYLGKEPAGVEFDYTATGKPVLRNRHGICFNVSHSAGLALFAIAKMDVGIDVEFMNPASADRDVAKHFFSARELSQLSQLPDDLWLTAFFRCWTEKEAALKASGSGLSAPTQAFDVPLLPGDPCLLNIAGRLWSVQSLDSFETYAASLAVNSEKCRLKLREWQPPPHVTSVSFEGSFPRQEKL